MDTILNYLPHIVFGGVAFFAIAYYLINRYIEKRKRDKEEFAKAQLLSQKIFEKNQTIKALVERDTKLKWKEILELHSKYGNDIYEDGEFFAKMRTADSIQELVVVSEIKEQIFWDGSFTKALSILNRIVDKTQKDEELRLPLESLNNLIGILSHKTNFAGYDSIMKSIQTEASLAYSLVIKLKK